MRSSSMFDAPRAEVDALVAAYPLAQTVSASAEGLHATALPVLLERDARGDGDWLVGHMARGNPHVALLRLRPRALFVFMGPHAYVSPSWLDDRSQAPTWNFCTVHFEADVEFQDDPASALAAVQALTRHMERHRARAWQVEEVGARRDRLLEAIVPFRARIVREQVKFKLGQNERPHVRRQIIDALDAQGDAALARRMRDAWAER